VKVWLYDGGRETISKLKRLNKIKGDKMNKCNRCGHQWIMRVSDPAQCPACRSRLWDGRASRQGINKGTRRRASKYGVHLMEVGKSYRLPFMYGLECDRRIRAIVAWGKRNGRRFYLGDNFLIRRDA